MKHRHHNWHRSRGFTLQELIVAVAIVAILASMGIRSYVKSTRKANRQIGADCVLEAQRRVETYYSHKGAYPTAAVTAWLSQSELRYNGVANPTCGDEQLYTLSVDNTSTDSLVDCTVAYCVVGTPQKGQVKDGTLRLAFNPKTQDPSQQLIREFKPYGSSTWQSGW